MLKFLLGVTQMERIEQFGDKERKLKLRWFGYGQNRDSGYISQGC